MFELILQLHAHKKGTGSSHNGRDSKITPFMQWLKAALNLNAKAAINAKSAYIRLKKLCNFAYYPKVFGFGVLFLPDYNKNYLLQM